MKHMTQADVIARLKKMQNGRSLSALGKDIGVSASFLSDVYLGRRGFGHKILEKLKLVQNPPTFSEMAESK